MAFATYHCLCGTTNTAYGHTTCPDCECAYSVTYDEPFHDAVAEDKQAKADAEEAKREQRELEENEQGV